MTHMLNINFISEFTFSRLLSVIRVVGQQK